MKSWERTVLWMVWLPLLTKSVSSQFAEAGGQVSGHPQGNPNNANPNQGLTFNHRAIINAVVEELTKDTLATMEELKPKFVAMAGDAIMSRPPTPPQIPTGLIQPSPGSERVTQRYKYPPPGRLVQPQQQQHLGPQQQKVLHHHGRHDNSKQPQYPGGQSQQQRIIQYAPGQQQKNQYVSGQQPKTQYAPGQQQRNQYASSQHLQSNQYGRLQSSAQAGSGAQYSGQPKNGGGQQFSRPAGQGQLQRKPTSYRFARSNQRWKYKHYDYNDEDRIDGW